MQLRVGDLTLDYDERTLEFRVTQSDGTVWETDPCAPPRLVFPEEEIPFRSARSIVTTRVKNGVGEGIRTEFRGFPGLDPSYAFATILQIDETSGDLSFSWTPLCEAGRLPERVFWPAPFVFAEPSDQWYTLLTQRQGMLIPNTWRTDLKPLAFDGLFLTAGSYMPWFAQVKEKSGYLAISTTPWDAGCRAEHRGEVPGTKVCQYLLPSLGRMRYPRILRMTFRENCTYTDLCKVYRQYVKEEGRLRTLREKAAENPAVEELIRCSFVHMGIKTYVRPDSDAYDPKNPEKNNHLTGFAERDQEIQALHAAGAGKIYLHLDGWAQPGYDNCHPDYYPVCQEAGGEEGLKALIRDLHQRGDLVGLHDQYRDFYRAAASYRDEDACMRQDGSIFTHSRWAGGPQGYLCASLAKNFVRRNFTRLFEGGIHPDCAYLDVFTCNDADECFNPEHPMTRRECLAYRAGCFSWLTAHGILPSSEEVSDWSIPSLVFCHYAPYEFMMDAPGTPREGIPVPLFNLVYHDCIIEPWMMDRVREDDDYMLYALLAGGAPYLRRDAAYPNIDGAFAGIPMGEAEMAARANLVSSFYQRIAMEELVSHELVGGDPQMQRSVFSDGSSVTVDFRKERYEIRDSGT